MFPVFPTDDSPLTQRVLCKAGHHFVLLAILVTTGTGIKNVRRGSSVLCGSYIITTLQVQFTGNVSSSKVSLL